MQYLGSRSLSHSFRAALVCTLVVWFITGCAHRGDAGGSNGRATLTFEIVDGPTGERVPAMICIRNLETQAIHLPPDGRVMEDTTYVDDFYAGIGYDHHDPDWLGPVRKMGGQGNNNNRAHVYGERPSIPYWEEPVCYQVRSAFSIQLPPGHYKLTVGRGMEYVPLDEVLVVGEDDQRHTLTLERWVDLPAMGWYSGDVHVHHPTEEHTHQEYLLAYAQAEDLHVVNVLEMGHHGGTDFKQAGFGVATRRRVGDYCLVSGQEEPRSTFGHIVGLNTSELSRDVATYDLYDLAFDRLHAQPDAVVGFAHFSWNGCDLPRGFPWYVTTEAIDFVELLQFRAINTLDYYEYLNLGFRLGAAAGSDVPWGSTIGEVRTYVYTGETLDLDRWFEGVEVGRTFVSNGPALTFTANGRLPGSEISFEGAGRVTIRGEAWGHPRVGVPEVLELVGPDGVIASAQRESEGQTALSLSADIAVERSQWLALVTRCGNGAVAHTSPIYVVVDGQPTWSPPHCRAIVDKQLAAIAEIEAEFADGTDQRSIDIRSRLQRAKRYYAQLLEASQSGDAE